VAGETDSRQQQKKGDKGYMSRAEIELEKARAQLETARKDLIAADKTAMNLKRDIDALELKVQTKDRELAEAGREHHKTQQLLKNAEDQIRNLQLINTVMLVVVVAAILLFAAFAFLG